MSLKFFSVQRKGGKEPKKMKQEVMNVKDNVQGQVMNNFLPRKISQAFAKKRNIRMILLSATSECPN